MGHALTVTPRKVVLHVLVHEIRHWAQVATLLRQQGVTPGFRDVLFSPALDPPAAEPTEAAAPPTLVEWMGGPAKVEELIVRFYEVVIEDPLLRPLFEHMDATHARHVATFISEVFGGPDGYSRTRGGHAYMIRKHLGKGITEEQRRRWVGLLIDTADRVGVPDDPEFRSAFVSYVEWGSRLAVINSQPGAEAEEDLPMPRWGWGEVGGPYLS